MLEPVRVSSSQAVSSVPVPAVAPGSRAVIGLCLIAVYVIWGSTYLALRYVVEGMPALLAGGLRYVSAGVILYVALRLRGAPRPTLREWAWSAPVGALLFLVGNGFVALAEREVASGLAATMCAAMPVFVAALVVLSGERPTVREWGGLLLGFGGVALMSVGDLRATPRAAILLVLAPIGWAVGSVWSRRLPLPRGLLSAATQMITGGVVLGVAGVVTGECWPEVVPARAVGALVYLVIAGSIVGFSAYSHLLRHARPATATSYAYVNPVLAVLLGAALAGEHPGPSTLLGGLLVIGGVALVLGRRR